MSEKINLESFEEQNDDENKQESNEKIKVKYTLLSTKDLEDIPTWDGKGDSDCNVGLDELSEDLKEIIFEDTEDEQNPVLFYYKELSPGKGVIFNCSGKESYDYYVCREEISDLKEEKKEEK
jgi:hypothetical protein